MPKVRDFFSELSGEDTVVRLNVTCEDFSHANHRAIDVLRNMRKDDKQAASNWYHTNAYRKTSKQSPYNLDKYETLLTFAKVDESGKSYVFGGAYRIVGFDDTANPDGLDYQYYVLEPIAKYDVLVDKLYIEDENQNYGAIKRLFEKLDAEVFIT